MGDDKLPDVSISARAEAIAKLEVKTEIPSGSGGRLVDAITDLIRPWSEARGLRADILRLQREEVALGIAIKARERIDLQAGNVKPIPFKLLGPLLEAASYEEVDDHYMKKMWADLIVSTATTGTSIPRFVSILKELNTNQAKLLENIATRNNFEGELPRDFDAVGWELSKNWISEDGWARELRKEFAALNSDKAKASVFFKKIQERLMRPGCYIVDAYLDLVEGRALLRNSQQDWDSEFASVFHIDLDVLQSLGLIDLVDLSIGIDHEHSGALTYYYITNFGVCFVGACTERDKLPLIPKPAVSSVWKYYKFDRE